MEITLILSETEYLRNSSNQSVSNYPQEWIIIAGLVQNGIY